MDSSPSGACTERILPFSTASGVMEVVVHPKACFGLGRTATSIIHDCQNMRCGSGTVSEQLVLCPECNFVLNKPSRRRYS